MKEQLRNTKNRICLFVRQEQIQSIINIIQLSCIGIVSYILLLFRIEHINGLGYVIISGIIFYVAVYIIEMNKMKHSSERRERILFVKNIFRLIYTAIYLTAIMIEIIRDADCDNIHSLVGKGFLFIWVTLWGTRGFWLCNIIDRKRNCVEAKKEGDDLF